MNGDIRDQLAKGYEAIENAKACFDKAKEMLEAKESAPPRNWPKRIEAGMVFRLAVDTGKFDCGAGHEYIAAMHKGGLRLTDLKTGERRSDADELFGADGDRNFTYLGHARDILTIRTDAHEPTGAELVGKACEFSDRLTGPWSPGICAAFGHNPTYQYRKAGGAEWKYARLAK